MTSLDKLITYFEKFPGIGARQARRFAFHILTMGNTDVDELAELIKNLRGSVVECERCHRFFATSYQAQTQCAICQDPNRDSTKLLVVERDNDITPIERSGVYDGLYFVLGGTVPLLDSTENSKLRGGALKATVAYGTEHGLTEIILGFAVNPDGENTARYVQQLLTEFVKAHNLTISELGRGLSTGSELEYADAETLKNALRNRH